MNNFPDNKQKCIKRDQKMRHKKNWETPRSYLHIFLNRMSQHKNDVVKMLDTKAVSIKIRIADWAKQM